MRKVFGIKRALVVVIAATCALGGAVAVAVMDGSSGTAAAKAEALEAAGVKVGKTPSATAALMREIMQSA